MGKLLSWKQPTPQDQFIAVLGSLRGELLNLEDNVAVTVGVVLVRAQRWLDELKLLQPFLTGEVAWDSPAIVKPPESVLSNLGGLA